MIKERLKTQLVLLTLLGMLFTAGGAVAGSTTADMNIIGNITVPQASCNVSATAPYFNITVSSGSGFPNGTITVNCAQGTSYKVAMDAGANYNAVTGERRVTNESNFLVYFLYQDMAFSSQWGDNDFANTYPSGGSLYREGTGSNETIPVYGQLVGTPTTGIYTDSVRVNIHF